LFDGTTPNDKLSMSDALQESVQEVSVFDADRIDMLTDDVRLWANQILNQSALPIDRPGDLDDVCPQVSNRCTRIHFVQTVEWLENLGKAARAGGKATVIVSPSASRHGYKFTAASIVESFAQLCHVALESHFSILLHWSAWVWLWQCSVCSDDAAAVAAMLSDKRWCWHRH
jgi:hypothetical protein